jgi:hypothetical protein
LPPESRLTKIEELKLEDQVGPALKQKNQKYAWIENVNHQVIKEGLQKVADSKPSGIL